jgi:hypothetical protein
MFEAVPEDVLDGALGQVGMTNFLVDLRDAAPHSRAAQWLQKDREMRAQDAQAWLVSSAAFDLVNFVKEITRAQPTPLALQRFQTMGHSSESFRLSAVSHQPSAIRNFPKSYRLSPWRTIYREGQK